MRSSRRFLVTSGRSYGVVTRVVMVGVLAGLAHVVVGAYPASAVCLAPTISVIPTTVSPGGTVSVSGGGFTSECQDVIVNGVTPPPAPPDSGLISLVQGQATFELAPYTAANDYTLQTTVTIPANAVPGPGLIKATSAEPVAILIAAPTTAPGENPTSSQAPSDQVQFPSTWWWIGTFALAAVAFIAGWVIRARRPRSAHTE